MLEFEWDEEKEQENFRIHGTHFKDAKCVFLDYLRMERHDDNSSNEEDRWQTMGLSSNNVLFVVYTERGDVTRIISARVAEPFERRIYYGDSETYGWHRVNP